MVYSFRFLSLYVESAGSFTKLAAELSLSNFKNGYSSFTTSTLRIDKCLIFYENLENRGWATEKYFELAFLVAHLAYLFK